MNAKLFAIAMALVATGAPAFAFRVVGDINSPILQTDDGQPFPGWDGAYATCINEMRAQKSNPYLLNCNQKVTNKLAQQDADRQIEALPPDLRAGVRSCISFQDIVGMRSGPN